MHASRTAGASVMWQMSVALAPLAPVIHLHSSRQYSTLTQQTHCAVRNSSVPHVARYKCRMYWLSCRLMTLMEPPTSWVAKWTHTCEHTATAHIWCLVCVSSSTCVGGAGRQH
jgi:hypothetical protein